MNSGGGIQVVLKVYIFPGSYPAIAPQLFLNAPYFILMPSGFLSLLVSVVLIHISITLQ